VNTWVVIFAATGVILSAAYMLYLYGRVIFGALVKPALRTIEDLSAREIAILAPLAALTILFGVYPKAVFDVTSVSVANLVQHHRMEMSAQADEIARNRQLAFLAGHKGGGEHSASPAGALARPISPMQKEEEAVRDVFIGKALP